MPVLSYISQKNALKIAEVLNNFTVDTEGGTNFSFSEDDDAKLDRLITEYAGNGASLRDIFRTAAAAVGSLGKTVDPKYQNFYENLEHILDLIDQPIYTTESLNPMRCLLENLLNTKIGQRMNRDQVLRAIDFYECSQTLNPSEIAAVLYSMYPKVRTDYIYMSGFKNASTFFRNLVNSAQTDLESELNLPVAYPDFEKLESSKVTFFQRASLFEQWITVTYRKQIDMQIQVLRQNLQGNPIHDGYTKDYNNFFKHHLADDPFNPSTFYSFLTSGKLSEFGSVLDDINDSNYEVYLKNLDDFMKHLARSRYNIEIHRNIFNGATLTSCFLLESGNVDLVNTMIDFGLALSPELTEKYYDPKTTPAQLVQKLSENNSATTPQTEVTDYSKVKACLENMDKLRINRAKEIATDTGVVNANQTVNWGAYLFGIAINGSSLAVSAVRYPFRLAVSAVTYPIRLFKGLFKGKQASNNVDSSPEATPDSSPEATPSSSPKARPAERAETPEHTTGAAAVVKTDTSHADRLTDRRSGQSTGAGRGQ